MKTLGTESRIEIQNILFLTDFSPAAKVALPYAGEFANRFGAKLYVLHVQAPIVNPMTPPASWPGIEKAAKEKTEQRRLELFQSFPGIQPEVIIEEGNFWEILDSAIEKNAIDLLVLGTRGRAGVEKLILGSKAEEILRQTRCAVLTAGPGCQDETGRRAEVKEIVYATDFSPESAAAGKYALSLAEEFQAHLTLLHVIPDEKPGDIIRGDEFIATTKRLLHALVPAEAEMWCRPQFSIEHGPAADKILEVAEKRNADLIVLGVPRSSGFPGAATHLPIATAHKVVAGANCLVLTIRG
jgi:nucleotide-binding universal stress UspA family protein